VNRGRLTAGESVVVLGGGPIGVGCAVAARDLGAAVLVVDPVGSRRELLAGCGFATVPTAGDVAAHPVLAAGGPEGPDVVIDTTGRAPVLATALELAGHGGRVVVVGMTAAAAPTSPGLLPIKELDVLGSSCCLLEEFAAAADLVARNRAVADALVSHVVPLDRVADAFELLEHRPTEAVKVLIDLTGTAP
jgi:L-gulonate 5-dehydrogenase